MNENKLRQLIRKTIIKELSGTGGSGADIATRKTATSNVKTKKATKKTRRGTWDTNKAVKATKQTAYDAADSDYSKKSKEVIKLFILISEVND